ncbi:MAG: DegV family protein, partial [Clostridiales bacterium]|nr:DegV family protein [Clostridiales bacterium]
VKPLITISSQGTIDVIGKKIGAKMGIRAVADMLDLSKVDPEYGVRFLYSYSPENSKDLIGKIGLKEDEVVELTDLGPIVGAHIGPNAYGYVYVEKED